MKSFLIVLFVISFAFSSDCWPSEWDQDTENKGTVFPESLSKDSVLSIMHLPDSICGIGIKKWPYKENTYIAVSEDSDSLYVGMIVVVGKTYSIEHRFSKAFGDSNYRFDRFDFAPYRIKKNVVAFGLRFYGNGPLAGGGYGCQNLALFAPVKDSLQVVLSTVMDGSALLAGEWLKDGSRIHYEELASAILIIGKPDSSGYNRIIKKMTTNQNTEFEGLYPNDTFYWQMDVIETESQYDDEKAKNPGNWYGIYRCKNDEMPMTCCCDRIEF